MPNPATLRVYYDEDAEDMSEREIQTQLEEAIENIDGVNNVHVGAIFTNRPYEAVVDIEFDETDLSSDELEHQISSFDFLHNAIVR